MHAALFFTQPFFVVRRINLETMAPITCRGGGWTGAPVVSGGCSGCPSGWRWRDPRPSTPSGTGTPRIERHWTTNSAATEGVQPPTRHHPLNKPGRSRGKSTERSRWIYSPFRLIPYLTRIWGVATADQGVADFFNGFPRGIARCHLATVRYLEAASVTSTFRQTQRCSS